MSYVETHIYGLDLIYLNHWSSITLELNIPFFFHMIAELLSYDPLRLNVGKFSFLTSTCLGEIHEDSRVEDFLYNMFFCGVQEDSRVDVFLY